MKNKYVANAHYIQYEQNIQYVHIYTEYTVCTFLIKRLLPKNDVFIYLIVNVKVHLSRKRDMTSKLHNKILTIQYCFQFKYLHFL